MKRVVLESPYSGDVTRNMLYLHRCIRDCIERGESPYASHLMLTTALDDSNALERQLGIEAGFAWRDAASYTVFYVDYGYSGGMLIAKANCIYNDHHFIERTIGQ